MNAGSTLTLKLGHLDGGQLKTDPLAQQLRIHFMSKNKQTQITPDAQDRAAKFLEIVFKTPHLLFGAIIWTYGAYWILVVSGLA